MARNKEEIQHIFDLSNVGNDIEFTIRNRIIEKGASYLNECVLRDNLASKNDVLKIHVMLYINNHYDKLNFISDLSDYLTLCPPFMEVQNSYMTLWKYIADMHKNNEHELMTIIIDIMHHIESTYKVRPELMTIVALNIVKYIDTIKLFEVWSKQRYNNGIEFGHRSLIWFCSHCDNERIPNMLMNIFNHHPTIRDNIIYMIDHGITINKKPNHVESDITQFKNQSPTNIIKCILSTCQELWTLHCNVSKIKIDKINFNDCVLDKKNNMNTKIFTIAYKSICITYTFNITLSETVKYEIQRLELIKNTDISNSNKQDVMLHLMVYRDLKKVIDDVIHDEYIFNFTTEFYSTVSKFLRDDNKNNIILSDYMNYSFSTFYHFVVDELKNNSFSDEIYELIENVMNGKYKTNSPTRYDFCTLFLKLKSSSSTKNKNIVEGLIQYSNNVDISELVTYKNKIKHNISIVDYINNIINNDDNFIFDFDKHAQSYIMKTISNMVNISNNMNESYYDIKDMYNSMIELTRGNVEKSFDDCFANDYIYANYVNKLFIHFYNCHDDVPTELSQMILRSTVSLCKSLIFPIYSKSLSVICTVGTMLNLIIVMLTKNDDFFVEIVPHIDIFLDIKKLSDVNNDYVDKIIKLINDSTIKPFSDNDINFTDEFIDSITIEPIVEPVLIPNIDDFFNKSTIVIHLLHSQTNPLTREELTTEIFKKYNKQADVITKINEFKLKKQKFIETYKLNNK